MTNTEKQELRRLVLQGKSFAEIRRVVGCSDATIRQYIKVFSGKDVNQTPPSLNKSKSNVNQNTGSHYICCACHGLPGKGHCGSCADVCLGGSCSGFPNNTPTQSSTDSPETYSTGAKPEGTELDVHGNPIKQSIPGILNDLLWKDITFDQAEAVILQWHTTLVEQAVLEARKSEVKRLSKFEGLEWSSTARTKYITNRLEELR